LYRMGGLYVDMDMECLRSFDVLHHCFDFYASQHRGFVEICILASRPGHPILKKILTELSKSDPSKNDFMEVINNTGPHFFRTCFMSEIDNCSDRTVILPETFLTAFPCEKRFYEANSKHKKVKKWIKPWTFSIHYWTTGWNPQKALKDKFLKTKIQRKKDRK